MKNASALKKQRIDALLAERKFAASREEAQRLIRAGLVLVDEVVIDKPGTAVDPEKSIRISGKACPYASRGGLKLAGALERFPISIDSIIAADLGASTGGFTDCLLQNGASKVFAIDVGHGQLAYALQTDPRVVVMDKTNCRYLAQDDLGQKVDLVVGDLSFISLKTVFPAIQRIAKPDGYAILLIKPQFEIGKGRVGKGGLVKNPGDHAEVIADCIHFIEQGSWKALDIAPSPIQGKTGNIEFFVCAQNTIATSPFEMKRVAKIVEEAHANKEKK